MTKFITIAGRSQAGKDTLADEIVATLNYLGHSAKKVAFADPLKQACHIIFGIPLEDMYTQEGKKKFTDLPWKNIARNIRDQFSDIDGQRDAGNLTIRELLQLVGTQLFRQQIDENIWAKAPFRLTSHDFIVVSDCRYPNEHEAAMVANAYTIRIHRNCLSTADMHISERALDHIADFEFDQVIYNDSTIDHLRTLGRNVAEKLAGKTIAEQW